MVGGGGRGRGSERLEPERREEGTERRVLRRIPTSPSFLVARPERRPLEIFAQRSNHVLEKRRRTEAGGAFAASVLLLSPPNMGMVS